MFKHELRLCINDPKTDRWAVGKDHGRLRCLLNNIELSVVVMRCQTLAERIEQIDPSVETADVARLCLLISNLVDDLDDLQDNEKLTTAHREANLRLQMGIDQHAAVSFELETLANSDPKQFDREQIWILLRAIKVQSQILQLYIGGEPIEV